MSISETIVNTSQCATEQHYKALTHIKSVRSLSRRQDIESTLVHWKRMLELSFRDVPDETLVLNKCMEDGSKIYDDMEVTFSESSNTPPPQKLIFHNASAEILKIRCRATNLTKTRFDSLGIFDHLRIVKLKDTFHIRLIKQDKTVHLKCKDYSTSLNTHLENCSSIVIEFPYHPVTNSISRWCGFGNMIFRTEQNRIFWTCEKVSTTNVRFPEFNLQRKGFIRHKDSPDMTLNIKNYNYNDSEKYELVLTLESLNSIFQDDKFQYTVWITGDDGSWALIYTIIRFPTIKLKEHSVGRTIITVDGREHIWATLDQTYVQSDNHNLVFDPFIAGLYSTYLLFQLNHYVVFRVDQTNHKTLKRFYRLIRDANEKYREEELGDRFAIHDKTVDGKVIDGALTSFEKSNVQTFITNPPFTMTLDIREFFTTFIRNSNKRIVVLASTVKEYKRLFENGHIESVPDYDRVFAMSSHGSVTQVNVSRTALSYYSNSKPVNISLEIGSSEPEPSEKPKSKKIRHGIWSSPVAFNKELSKILELESLDLDSYSDSFFQSVYESYTSQTGSDILTGGHDYITRLLDARHPMHEIFIQVYILNILDTLLPFMYPQKYSYLNDYYGGFDSQGIPEAFRMHLLSLIEREKIDISQLKSYIDDNLEDLSNRVAIEKLFEENHKERLRTRLEKEGDTFVKEEFEHVFNMLVKKLWEGSGKEEDLTAYVNNKLDDDNVWGILETIEYEFLGDEDADRHEKMFQQKIQEEGLEEMEEEMEGLEEMEEEMEGMEEMEQAGPSLSRNSTPIFDHRKHTSTPPLLFSEDVQYRSNKLINELFRYI